MIPKVISALKPQEGQVPEMLSGTLRGRKCFNRNLTCNLPLNSVGICPDVVKAIMFGTE